VAAPYTVRLTGGPCNGQVKTLTKAEWDAGVTTCKGAVYEFSGVKPSGGQLPRFTYRAGAPQPPPTGPGATATHSLKAWGDLRRQVNEALPAMLQHVEQLRRGSLSQLSHRHRVRG